ncbi:hypothetical protein LIER_02045 [Lithospermum erythrorhizon]|uniref:Uncharacterized protein n=1 Tax=Lithospermum erythrorhizon TaxID=34254 RepID=A0AAV3NQI2_LITER
MKMLTVDLDCPVSILHLPWEENSRSYHICQIFHVAVIRILDCIFRLLRQGSNSPSISLYLMLEALKHANEKKVKKMEGENKVAVRALYKALKETYVRIICGEDIEDGDDMCEKATHL